MNNAFNYIPILRWKQAEVSALCDLTNAEREQIRPLFELLPKKSRNSQENLDNCIAEIQKKLMCTNVFLDLTEVYGFEKEEGINLISNYPPLFEYNIVPVLHLDDLSKQYSNPEVKEYVSKLGICLRIFKEELSPDIYERINRYLKNLNLERAQVDLLFDYQITDLNDSSNVISLLKRDDNSSAWRSLFFASGAFRKDLQGLKPDTHPEKRNDWFLWKEINNAELSRKVGYSDYTIQHPIIYIVDSPNTSFSIRYAQEEYWLILKGQAKTAKNNADNKHYYAHSQILVDEGLIDESCCKGDQYIKNLSNNPDSSKGNPTTWIKNGINHHIALTIRQLKDLN